MSGLALSQAPPPNHPLRFLLSALAWGVLAGLWLAWLGPMLLLSRWTPATVVLVHAFTLGVLGNAMLGSLVQFLPVAAGSPLPDGRFVPLLHVLFNIGLTMLLVAMIFPQRVLAGSASVLLISSLGTFSLTALVAVCRGHGIRVLRLGIGMALVSLQVTAVLGVLLLAVLLGRLALPLDHLADLHAAFGLTGWVLALLTSVGSITLPMFQGTRAIPGRALLAWLVLLVMALALAVRAALQGDTNDGLRGLCLPILAFCIAVPVLQWRADHRRNPTLRHFWSAGCVALAAACAVVLWPTWPLQVPAVVLAGMLAIAIALPWLLLGMLLEIIGFLTWIELRRRHPRGVCVPGVDTLFPESYKRWLLLAHAVAALALLAATLQAPLTRLAGILLALAYLATLVTVWRCWQTAGRAVPLADACP